MSHRWKKPRQVAAKQSLPAEPAVQSQRRQVTFNMAAPFPGTRANLIICSEWKGDDPRNLAGPSGAPGAYKATFVLVRVQQTMLSTEARDADSFVIVPTAASSPEINVPRLYAECKVEQQTIKIEGYVNSDGRLASLVVPQIDAAGFSDAAEKAETAVYRLLSRIALRYHVPVSIGRIEVVETATSNPRVSLVMPYADAVLNSRLEIEG